MERESEEKAQREAMRASESNTTEPNVRLRGVLELQYRTHTEGSLSRMRILGSVESIGAVQGIHIYSLGVSCSSYVS